jgi:hypothetical protein
LLRPRLVVVEPLRDEAAGIQDGNKRHAVHCDRSGAMREGRIGREGTAETPRQKEEAKSWPALGAGLRPRRSRLS